MRIVPVFGGPPTPYVLWCIAGSILLFECVFQLADHGVVGSFDLRSRLFRLAAFWDNQFPPGTVDDALYPGQSYVMLVSYVFLHAGMIHAFMNAVILISLSKTLAIYLSLRLVLISMVLGAISSALFFGWLANTSAPMIGASGVVFALIGLWLHQSRSRSVFGDSKQSIAVIIFALTVIHIVLHVLMSGQLAWQAHLGGFIIGYIVMPWFLRFYSPQH